VCATIGALACGSATPTQPEPRPEPTYRSPFVFRLSYDTGRYGYRLRTFRSDPTTGVLTSVAELPLEHAERQFIAHPGRPFLFTVYMAERKSFDQPPPPLVVRTYSVDGEGRLNRLDDLPLPAAFGQSLRFSFDPSGDRVYLIGERTVALCEFRPDGVPSIVASDVFPNVRVNGLTFASRFMYVITRSEVRVYTFDPATGLAVGNPLQLTSGGESATYYGGTNSESAPQALSKLLVAYGPASPTEPPRLQPYSIDAVSGRLSAIPGAAFSPKVAREDIQSSWFTSASAYFQTLLIHPSGRFVYVGESVEGGIQTPTHFHQEPVASRILGYRFDPQARTFTPVPGSPIYTSRTPKLLAGTLESSPDGTFLYSGPPSSTSAGKILGYRIDAETGALTPLPVPAFQFPESDYYY
jgi:hypothetical protein